MPVKALRDIIFDKKLSILAGWLIDGSGAPIQRKVRLDLDNGSIQSVRKIPVKFAVDAGCDSIEHGFFMGEENLKRMAGRGTFWVPTAHTIEKVIQIASHNGALLLDLPRVGQLKENMDANFIAVKGDSSQLPESLNQIKITYNKRKYIN